MFPQLKGSLALLDGQERDLGQITLDRIEKGVVFGRFTPGAEFARVQGLFEEYVEAANDQLLSRVGELDRDIAELRLRLRSSEAMELPDIYDVQIGGGIITFRTRPVLADRAPSPAAMASLPASEESPDPHPV